VARFLVISSSIKNIVLFHFYYKFAPPIRTLSQPCFSLHPIFPFTNSIFIVFNFLQLNKLTLAQLLFVQLSFHPPLLTAILLHQSCIALCRLHSINSTLILNLDHLQSCQLTMVFNFTFTQSKQENSSTRLWPLTRLKIPNNNRPQ
jgi:hypothetical protein